MLRIRLGFPDIDMRSRGYGLPASTFLFGTIYAIALAVAPTSSTAARQGERAHEARQIADTYRPVRHNSPQRSALERARSGENTTLF